MMAMAEVSAEQAMQSPYYGVSGWLLVIYVLSVICMLSSLFELLSWLSMIGTSEASASVIDPSVGGLVSTVQLALTLPFLILTPMKHPQMPVMSIVCLWIYFATGIVSLAAQILLLKTAADQMMSDPSVWGEDMINVNDVAVPLMMNVLATVIVIGGIITSLVTWYLLASKRVNATFRHRLPYVTATASPAHGSAF